MCKSHSISALALTPTTGPRTTLWQIIKFAWAIYRSPSRRWLRIGQFVGNCTGSYYTENDRLITLIKEMNRG